MNSSTNALVVERTKQIVDLHLGIEASLRRSVQDAIRIGELLTSQKDALGHGNFLPWVEKDLPFSERTAQNYMRVFEYRTKTATLADLRTAYEVAQIEDQRQHPKVRPQVAPEVVDAQRERHEAFAARMAEDVEPDDEPTIDVDDLLKRAHETMDATRRGSEAVKRGDDPKATLAAAQDYLDSLLSGLDDSGRHMVVNGLIKWLRDMSVDMNRKAALV